MKARKYLIEKEAVCSDCEPHREYAGPDSVDEWAKLHVYANPTHIVTIHETHDVAMFD